MSKRQLVLPLEGLRTDVSLVQALNLLNGSTIADAISSETSLSACVRSAPRGRWTLKRSSERMVSVALIGP